MRKQHSLCVTVAIILIAGGTGSAQSDANKIEVGTQVTSLTLFHPDGYGDVTEPGFGGRITYNFNRKVAVEAEGNFFPNQNVFQGLGEGRAIQVQFGVKAGKRFKKFGIFAKLRPGFLSVGEVFSIEPGSTAVFDGYTLTDARIGRKTFFTTDVGGVLELYPSARAIVRFDAGDTILRYGPRVEYDPLNVGQFIKTAARVTHNFHFTTGVGIRLGKSGKDDNPGNPSTSRRAVPRFEVGMQFTSLSVNHPRHIGCCVLFSSDRGPITEPGFGGRFTFNLTDNIALEAETNFYTRDTFDQPGGRMFQGQFGVKAGKRFSRFGVFGKVRPGFLGFTRASQLLGTQVVFAPVLGRTTVVGDFREGTTKYFSNDMGGVIEFYISRRVMTRMDFGDTIVRYGEYAIRGFIASQQIVRRPPETRHNFQYTAGVGFRF